MYQNPARLKRGYGKYCSYVCAGHARKIIDTQQTFPDRLVTRVLELEEELQTQKNRGIQVVDHKYYEQMLERIEFLIEENHQLERELKQNKYLADKWSEYNSVYKVVDNSDLTPQSTVQ